MEFSTANESFGAIAGNRERICRVSATVSRRIRATSIFLLALSLGAATYGDYAAAKEKFDRIEGGRLRPGSRVVLSFAELNAWVAREAPAGVRNPRVQAPAREIATGNALIDFGKLERNAGRRPGWLMSKLLDGERPVSVTARIRSAGGQATVDIQRVEISGITIDGRTLDFLIENFLLPMYPGAAISRPFEMGHRIDRLAPERVARTVAEQDHCALRVLHGRYLRNTSQPNAPSESIE